MSIRLVVTDLDGTFLAPDRSISDDAVQTARALRDRGILFTFITGRPWCAAQRFALRTEITLPTITCNGAVINQGYRMLWRKTLKLDLLREALERAGGLGLTVLYSERGREAAMYETGWTRARPDYQVRLPPEEEWARLQVDKVNIMGEDAVPFLALREELRALERYCTIVYYGNTGCEIMAKGINKAVALRQYAKCQGIGMEDVMAIGDNENDLEMLQNAHIGVAVANATPEAKAAADYVCTRERTEGVIEAIQKFCL